MSAFWRAVCWAMRIVGFGALIGAGVILMSPVTIGSGAAAATCGSALSRNMADLGDYAGTCTTALMDQRTLGLVLATVGTLVLLSRAKWVLMVMAGLAKKREPGRPDWVSA